MLTSTSRFIKYFKGIRQRSLHFMKAIPADKVDWSPAPGEFTFGDLIRHLLSSETMFVTAVVDGRWFYAGHHQGELPASLAALSAYGQASHSEAMTKLATLADADLFAERISLDGTPVRNWRLLMALVEHEVHHRSQLAMYLMLNKVTSPHIYGLGVEDVIARATG